MKRFLLSVLSTASLAAHAATRTVPPQNEPGTSHQVAIPQLLSVQTFDVGRGVSVQLPKVELADGTICQSYVSQASEAHSAANPPGAFVVRVATNRVCGKAAVVPSGFFGERKEVVPENLRAMKIVTANGLSFQMPVLLTSP